MVRHLPRPMPAHAEDGEDIAASRYFGWPCKGVYVDVGCNHAMDCNNTYLFYQLGWRGIAIDANKAHAESFAKHRPDDVFVHAGVAAEPGDLTFYHFDIADRISTLDRATAEDWKAREKIEWREEVVPVRTINEILTSNNITQVDLLSIDIENKDDEVIRTFDFTRWRPRVILIEDHTLSVYAAYQSKTVRFLTEQNYVFDGRMGNSSIYFYPCTPLEQKRRQLAIDSRAGLTDY